MSKTKTAGTISFHLTLGDSAKQPVLPLTHEPELEPTKAVAGPGKPLGRVGELPGEGAFETSTTCTAMAFDGD